MELLIPEQARLNYTYSLVVIPSDNEVLGSGRDLNYEDSRVSENLESQNEVTSEKSDELELQDLIARIVKQDQAAFSVLFKAMSSRVYSLALRITGSKQLAEEVTEDTLFQVWRQAPRFDPERGTAKTWILTIARSRALDARRSVPFYESQENYETEPDMDNHNHDELPDLLSAIEENDKLHSALENLDPLPRQLIALSFFRGLSHEEISAQANLPLGTVKSHLRRAVINLREALTAQAAVVHQ
jgi:RNA polymerase sigma factor (sigma-70 family)